MRELTLFLSLSLFINFFAHAESASGKRKSDDKNDKREHFVIYNNPKNMISKGVVLSYSETSDEYTFIIRGKAYRYPRDEYKRMLKRHMFDVNSEDYEQLEKTVAKHAAIYRVQNPSERELLEEAFQVRDYALGQVEARTGDCDPNAAQNQKDPSYTNVVYSADAAKIEEDNEKIIEAALANRGFFPLGELSGMKIEIMTSNDNFLHGALSENGLGLTQSGKGIEGDDRGKTFGIQGEVALDFTEGGIAIRKYAKGYGKKVPQAEEIKIGQQVFKTQFKDKDGSGRYYQEFLSIDGVEFEVVKSFPAHNVYLKFIGRREVLDDQSGLAKTMQENWHKNASVKYNYLDHRDRETRYSAEIGVGKSFDLVKNENYSVSTSLEATRNFSTYGSSDQYYRVKGDLKAVYLDENSKGEKFPSWEARFYVEGKAYDDKEVDHSYGVEVTKRFNVTDNGYLYIKGGVAHEDDRYSRQYADEEMRRKGRLDLQHYIGAGFEYRF